MATFAQWLKKREITPDDRLRGSWTRLWECQRDDPYWEFEWTDPDGTIWIVDVFEDGTAVTWCYGKAW